ncbi:hypothetical protein M2351_007758 [Azospirillum canadense]|nr:hypothetical protein [Azospirillum canadense]
MPLCSPSTSSAGAAGQAWWMLGFCVSGESARGGAAPSDGLPQEGTHDTVRAHPTLTTQASTDISTVEPHPNGSQRRPEADRHASTGDGHPSPPGSPPGRCTRAAAHGTGISVRAVEPQHTPVVHTTVYQAPGCLVPPAFVGCAGLSHPIRQRPRRQHCARASVRSEQPPATAHPPTLIHVKEKPTAFSEDQHRCPLPRLPAASQSGRMACIRSSCLRAAARWSS